MLSNISSINRFKKIAFSLTLSTLVLFPATATAQVRVSPLVIETEAKRGQADTMISITNTTEKVSRIRIYAEPFTYGRDTGLKSLPANSPNSLAPYLQFSPRELTIQPGKTRRVRAISRLAPNLPDGEYRAVIYNESLSESNDIRNRNVNIITRIGVTFFVTKGNVFPQLAIEKASFIEKHSKMQILIRNTGKASARPKVNWTLRRQSNVIKSGSQDETTVIAQGDRNIVLHTFAKNEPSLTPGVYQLSGELLWGENGRNKQSFNVNLTVPTEAARKK